MKEAVSTILLVLLIMALAFLFDGTPDLWDKLHEHAMQAASCTKNS